MALFWERGSSRFDGGPNKQGIIINVGATEVGSSSKGQGDNDLLV